MEFKDLISVSGKSDLFVLHSSNKNGVIVSSLGDNRKLFVSAHRHMISPLENIGIYTHSGDTIDMIDVLRMIKESKEKLPDNHAPAEELKSWFLSIVPDYDSERVYVSDIKKMIKWYASLEKNKSLDLLEIVDEDKTEEE